MKLVIATGIFPPDVGGPATFVPMIAGRWLERGLRVEVATYSDGLVHPSWPFPVRRVSRALPLPFRYAAYAWNLWRASRGARVIFAQDGVASGFPAWLVACLRRKRFVVKIVGDFAWEHARVQDGYEGSIEAFQDDANLPRRIRAMNALQRFTARRADAVITPSKYLGRLVEGWGVTPAQIRVVYNGVESPVDDRQTPAANGQPSTARHPRRIITAGRLVPWKGFDTLIEALPKVREKIPDAELVIAGDGPREELLRIKARVSGVEDAVRFTGRLGRGELQREISESGAFALVSSYEGFSHQLVEAFHSGTPVVASDAGGNPELVRDGENGLLVPTGDPKSTAAALIRLLEDRAFAERLAARARQDAGRFTTENQVKETAETLLGGDSPRVVLVSRDGSLADPASRGAARMRLYASRIGALHIVALAASDSRSARLADNLTVEVFDVRRPLASMFRASRAAVRAVRKIGANLVVAQDPAEAGLVAWFAARRTRRPLLIEEHGGVYLNPYWKSERLKNRLLHRVGLMLLGSADSLRTVSRRIGDDLRRRFPGKPVGEVPVLTESVSCQPPTAGGSVFGYVGRFVPQKNLPLLLRAFHTVHHDDPDSRLIMAGGGPLEGELRRQAAEYGLGEAVEWLPFDEDVSKIYSRIGTLVLPSDYEGWGRVVIEAMQCGIPVVMTDVGCAGEALRDGHEGFVVPVGDHEKLIQAMRRISEKGTHELMAAAARVRARSFPNPEEMAGRLTGFWKSVSGFADAPEAAASGPKKVRVVVVSRDPMAADPASYVSERLANYAERVGAFHVIVLAKREAMPPTASRNHTVEVVDARAGLLSLFRLFARLRAAVSTIQANLITTQDPFEGAAVGILVARLGGIRCIPEDHGAFYASRIWPRESLLNALRWALGMITMRLADAIRVEGEYQRRRYLELGVDKPTVVAPLAMKLDMTPVPFRTGPPTFLFAGRFYREKNVIMLVRAFDRVRREVPGVKLILSGLGPEEESLREAIEERGLENIAEIRPWTHDPEAVYREADVAVMPTDRECWPRFPLEAMSFGIPVIMTQVGMAGDVIRDGVEGFVVPVRGEEELVQAMLRLAKDENLRKSFREAGLARTKEYPSNEELAEKMVNFWAETVSG